MLYLETATPRDFLSSSCKTINYFVLASCAAIIETTIENAKLAQIITFQLFQKFGSIKDGIIISALQIRGTYQILLGFDLTIKKQPQAIIKSFIK